MSVFTAARLKDVIAESFKDFLIPERSAPAMIDKFQIEKRIFPLTLKSEVKIIKIQSRKCGRIFNFFPEQI